MGSSSASARMGSMFAPYVVWLVCTFHRCNSVSDVTETKDMLRTLHWLPIKQRVQFKMLILVFKAINGLAPNYITNLVNIFMP